MIQFGMPTLIENRTLEDNAALCSSLGLKFIELNMNFPEYQVERLEQTDTMLQIAERAGIYYTIHLDENLNIADFNQLVTEAYLETVRRSIVVAQKLMCLRDRYGDDSQPFTLNIHMNHGIYITLPDRSTTSFNNYIYISKLCHFRKFSEIICGKAPARLQIIAAEVPIDCPTSHFCSKRWIATYSCILFLHSFSITGSEGKCYYL